MIHNSYIKGKIRYKIEVSTVAVEHIDYARLSGLKHLNEKQTSTNLHSLFFFKSIDADIMSK